MGPFVFLFILCFSRIVASVGATSLSLEGLSFSSLIPELTNILDSDSVEISQSKCTKDLLGFLKNVTKRESVAIQMLDAFGKIPPNLKRGHLQWTGSFDECRAVPNYNKTAAYCVVRLGPSDELADVQRSPALGTCFPASCGPKDIEDVLNKLLKSIGKKIPEARKYQARKTVCDTASPWEAGTYATIIVAGAFVVLSFFGLGVELCHPRWDKIKSYFVVRRKEMIVDDDEQLIVEAELTDVAIEVSSTPEMTKAAKAFISFSFVSSWNWLTAPRADDLPYLNGMRVATIWWVILGELFSLGQIAYENPFDYMDGMKTFLGQLVANTNLAADTFFILSGLVLTYTTLQKLSRRDEPSFWIRLYFRRIYRLVPVYGLLILVFMYIVPQGVSGPLAFMVIQDLGNPLEFCTKNWWTNLLFINNFIPTNILERCMDWTWFLAVDMQLFLMTPPIVYLLRRWSRIGVSLIVALIAGTLVANAVIEARWGLPIAMFQLPLKNSSGYDPNYDYVFSKPYTRASPYLLGMLLGYLFHIKPTWKFPYPKWDIVFNLGCWIASCIVANRVIFGLYDHSYDSPTAVDMTGRVSWQMLSRFGFSAAVSWVIFACHYDYAGPIRDILEWKVWRPLSHFTYVIYLFHPIVLQLYIVNQADPFYFNIINMTAIFFAGIFACYFLLFPIVLFIEIPLLRLDQLFFR